MIFFMLFWNFFLIGCFSFGGGYAMLPLMDRQVSTQGWMTTQQFTDVITISGMLPGSIGTNAAAFVGYQTAGLSGALAAVLGIVTPSLILILVIGQFFMRIKANTIINWGFYGLKPVIVSLILFSAIKFSLSMEIVTTISWQTVSFFLILISSLILLLLQKLHPVMIILLSGLFGMLLYH